MRITVYTFPIYKSFNMRVSFLRKTFVFLKCIFSECERFCLNLSLKKVQRSCEAKTTCLNKDYILSIVSVTTACGALALYIKDVIIWE